MGIWGSLTARLRRGQVARPIPSPAAPARLRLVADNPQPIAPDLPVGIWPEDPDAVPAWIIRGEERLRALGREPNTICRTRRDYERQVALCEAALMETTRCVPMLSDPLSPPDAAKAFLTWVRDQNRCGEYSDQALKDLYADHCQATRRPAIGDNHMRKHLLHLAGVSKGLSEERTSGRRQRPTVWKLGQSLATVVEQRRRAA